MYDPTITFERTGNVRPKTYRHGPPKPPRDMEQLFLLRLIPVSILAKCKQSFFFRFGVALICKALKFMGCTRKVIQRIALQLSDKRRAKFMAEALMCDPSMFLWRDKSGCDLQNCMRKCLQGMTPRDHRLLNQNICYSAIPVMSLDGIHDVYLVEGNVTGEKIHNCFLPVLQPFNPHSVVIMDNASIHHIEAISDLIED